MSKLLIVETNSHGGGYICYGNTIESYYYDDGGWGDIYNAVKRLIDIGFVSADDVILLDTEGALRVLQGVYENGAETKQKQVLLDNKREQLNDEIKLIKEYSHLIEQNGDNPRSFTLNCDGVDCYCCIFGDVMGRCSQYTDDKTEYELTENIRKFAEGKDYKSYSLKDNEG